MQAVRTGTVVNRKLKSGSKSVRRKASGRAGNHIVDRMKEVGFSGAKAVRSDVAQIRSFKAIVARIIIFVALILLVGIVFDAYSSAVNYEIYNKKAEIAEIKNDIDTLSLKIASANSPNVIEAKAKELGMEYPSVSQYVYINAASSSDKTDKKENRSEKNIK